MKLKTTLFAILLCSSAGAIAADNEFQLVIREHKFEPAELTVPAGQKIRLVVKNEDATPEEFESRKLKREKVIAGKGSATLLIGPLAPGVYPFAGEYHEASAQGKLIAK